MTDLNQKQSQAVVFIANGMRLTDVARALKVSDRTLRTWRNLPEFARQLREIKQDYYDSAQNKLCSVCDRAVTSLIELSENPGIPPQVRLRACEVILNFSKPTESDDDLNSAVKTLCTLGIMPANMANKLSEHGEHFVEAMKKTMTEGFDNV